MDWFKWLSSSNLDLSLVHQYGVLFKENELQEDDIPFFNHELLTSMGITIAKHRIEILKLLLPPPTKHKSRSVLFGLKRTQKSFTKYMFETWANIHKEAQKESNALAIVPVSDGNTGKLGYDQHGSRLNKGLTMLRRTSTRKVHAPNRSATTTPDSYYSYKKQPSMRFNMVDITTTKGRIGSPLYGDTYTKSPRSGSFSTSPFGKECLQMVDRMNGHENVGYVDDLDFDDGYWSAGMEETKWDSMFHNLKPT